MLGNRCADGRRPVVVGGRRNRRRWPPIPSLQIWFPTRLPARCGTGSSATPLQGSVADRRGEERGEGGTGTLSAREKELRGRCWLGRRTWDVQDERRLPTLGVCDLDRSLSLLRALRRPRGLDLSGSPIPSFGEHGLGSGRSRSRISPAETIPSLSFILGLGDNASRVQRLRELAPGVSTSLLSFQNSAMGSIGRSLAARSFGGALLGQ